MRTRKVSVLLENDAAVQFDMLATILGLPAKHRKQSEADAALLALMTSTFQAVVIAALKAKGANWCEADDVTAFLTERLAPQAQAD